MVDGSRSSPTAKARATWVRFLVPQVNDLLFLGLFAVLVFTPLSGRLLGDAGVGWHIRTGQLIAQTKSIPRVDPFSSIMHGRPWFAWEWFYDLVVGKVESIAGLDGVVVMHAALIALVFACTFLILRRRGTGLFLAIGLTTLAASASMVHFLARPHVLTWLFTVVWLGWLDDASVDAEPSDKKSLQLIWKLPVSMVFWVNIHGGFITGFVLLAAFAAGSMSSWLNARKSDFADVRAAGRGRTLVYAGALSLVSTLANPYFWHLHAHIYRYLTDRWLMNHVQEFQSPNFHDPAAKSFIALLFLTVIAYGFRSRPHRLTECLLVLFAISSGLYSARNLPVAAILLAFVAGPLLNEALEQRTARNPRGLMAALHRLSLRMGHMDAAFRGHFWPALGVVLVAAMAVQGRVGSESLHAGFDPQRFPENAVRELKASADHEPVFAPDYWGGYFIYELYPGRLVVVDDRHDLYGAGMFKIYLNTYRLSTDWNEFIVMSNVKLIVWPKEQPLAQALRLSPDWKMVAEDEVSVTLRRRDGTVQ